MTAVILLNACILCIVAIVVRNTNSKVDKLTQAIKDLSVITSKHNGTVKKEMREKGLPTGESYFCTSDIPDPIINRPSMRTLTKKK